MLPERMDSEAARVEVYAIGGQESGFIHRRQLGNGPARGLWQMERGGGVLGVLQHPATRILARAVCERRNVASNSFAAWQMMEFDDVLAAAFARLLLWTDVLRLPPVGDVNGAWQLYLRTWRPGKPRAGAWPGNYMQASSQTAKEPRDVQPD